MTGIEGETAVIALGVCAVTPWALIAAGKLKTATQARKAASTTAAAEPAPARPVSTNGWEKRQRDPKTGQFLPDPTPLREAS